MNFMALDLEHNQPSGKIIQIGAIVGDIHTEEFSARLDILVDPYEPIDSFIVDLCAITDEMIAQRGVHLIDAYQTLVHYHNRYSCATNPIVWGANDSATLRNQLEQQGMQFSDGYTAERQDVPPYVFGYRFLDAKTLFQTWRYMNGQGKQRHKGGLSKALPKVGLEFKGQKHNAADDAYNTFRIWCKLARAYKGFSP